jgi:hypothetical protein
MLGVILNICHCQGPVPFHVKGNFRADGEDSRDRRGRNPQPLCQRVGKVVVVKDIEVTHEQAGPRIVEVNLDGIVPHRDHPENIVSVDMYVVVVNLLREVGHSNWIGIDVQSNKGERASVLLAVGTYEFALAETHIGLERQWRLGARLGVCSHPAAADVR